MLHLRSGRVPNVILRIVSTGFSRQPSATIYSSAQTESQETNPDRTNAANLAFTIPGLSKRELKFLEQQVRILVKPDCLAEFTTESKFIYWKLIVRGRPPRPEGKHVQRTAAGGQACAEKAK